VTETAAAPKPDILIVDDAPVNLQLLGGMLTDRGYAVRAVPNGRTALRVAASRPPDLILLDVSMPEMDGYEVCAELKRDEALKRIPVIFISALGETEDKVKGFRAGGLDYVTKPFQFEEVSARVETHLELRRLQLETERRLRELREAHERLRELEGLRDSLTHMIVHDMRTPLTAIRGSLQLLEMGLGAAIQEEQKADLTLAYQGSTRLLAMINDLLDVSRLEAGQMPLSLADDDLVRVAGAAIDPLAPLAASRKVKLVAPEAPPLRLKLDAEIVQRVLTNLLGNALKFAPRGEEVRVGVSRADGGARVAVADDGPGIPKELQGKLFQKFGQAEVQKEHRMHSTGLGLAFCKLAVEAHGGRIGLESEAGKGSVFWFELPMPAL
jgi:signal transduction histidine kinase